MKRQQILSVSIDHLKKGATEVIDQIVEAETLDLNDKELKFVKPVKVHATCYVAGDYLMVEFTLESELETACALCNEKILLPLKIKSARIEEALESLPHGNVDIGPFIREACLLEVPFYPQCGGKSCKNQKELEKYLSRPDSLKVQKLPLDDIL